MKEWGDRRRTESANKVNHRGEERREKVNETRGNKEWCEVHTDLSDDSLHSMQGLSVRES